MRVPGIIEDFSQNMRHIMFAKQPERQLRNIIYICVPPLIVPSIDTSLHTCRTFIDLLLDFTCTCDVL